MRATRRLQRFGFTIIQLLVVLALILFMAAMLFPAIQKVRDAAATTQSMNNLKQMALAMHNYHDVNKGMPPTVGEMGGQTGPVHFHILPYIDQQAVYNAAEGASWKNQTYGIVIPVYLDPRDGTLPDLVYKNWLATTNYAVNWMVTKEGKTNLAAIPDGTSNTLMFTQRYQMCNGAPTAWGYPAVYTWAPMFAYYTNGKFQSDPAQDQCDPRLPQAFRGHILGALCDGSVRNFSDTMMPTSWYYLCDPADGNPLPDDVFQ
jgi:type II secretory pathway pseudopilin PulG